MLGTSLAKYSHIRGPRGLIIGLEVELWLASSYPAPPSRVWCHAVLGKDMYF